jgi:site-specific recombinase XerD
MPQETIKYLSTNQVEKLLSKIDILRDKAMFTLMYLYGLRISEATSIRLDDVRLNDNRMFIRASKNGISGEQVLNKQSKKYLIPWLEERKEIVSKKKIGGVKMNSVSNFDTDSDKDILFISKKGNRLDNSQVFRLFKDYAKKARIPEDKRHPHVLRHSIAVHMAEDGVPVEYVQQHLRHRKIDNTMVYFQITNKRRHEMQEKALGGDSIARV